MRTGKNKAVWVIGVLALISSTGGIRTAVSFEAEERAGRAPPAPVASAGVDPAIPHAIPQGARLRDATLQGLNGPPRRLSDYRGRPLIINLWASWCGPCREEMASLERLSWRPEARYFAIIGVSTDDDPGRAADILERTHATLTQLIDHDRVMEDMLGASHIPLTVMVGADGRVLARFYGAREWDSPQALALIEASLRASARPGPMREHSSANSAADRAGVPPPARGPSG